MEDFFNIMYVGIGVIFSIAAAYTTIKITVKNINEKVSEHTIKFKEVEESFEKKLTKLETELKILDNELDSKANTETMLVIKNDITKQIDGVNTRLDTIIQRLLNQK